MNIAKFTFLIILFSGVVTNASAREVHMSSYRDRLAKSSLVVIATPVSKTSDTPEKTDLPGIFFQSKNNQQVAVAAVGVETNFIVSTVLKGDAALTQFTLHHYRQVQANATPLDAPALIAFDPTFTAKRSSFLMFLVRESDGRYAPADGQVDPGFDSVIPMPVDSDPALLKTLNTMAK